MPDHPGEAESFPCRPTTEVGPVAQPGTSDTQREEVMFRSLLRKFAPVLLVGAFATGSAVVSAPAHASAPTGAHKVLVVLTTWSGAPPDSVTQSSAHSHTGTT